VGRVFIFIFILICVIKMNKMTPEFAEILGLLCSEGCHIISYSSYWEKGRHKPRYRRNKKSERIEFYNKDKKLLLHYQKLLSKEFSYSSSITKHGKINLCNKSIIKSILNQTRLGHLNWKVPNKILKSIDKIKIAYLRGFFDGDGTASGCIRIFSTNKSGISQISNLLFSLNFKHTIQKPVIRKNRKQLYIIQISRKDEDGFLNTIEPISKFRPPNL
jgi:intein/homing endonuclease